MKLIYAILRNDNVDEITEALAAESYSVTKLSTIGGGTRRGNTTLLIGTEDELVHRAVEIMKKECRNTQKIIVNMPYVSGTSVINYETKPMAVEGGGATIFVVDVEKYEKI